MSTPSDGFVRADTIGAQIASDKLDAALAASFPSSDPISATQRHFSTNTVSSRVIKINDYDDMPTERPFVLVREHSEPGTGGFQLTWWCEREDTPGRIEALFSTLEAATTAAQNFAEAHSIKVVHVFHPGLFHPEDESDIKRS
jgi:hypothetical protein